MFIQLADFFECARDLQVPFSVEPPESSWLWHLPPFAALLKDLSSVHLFRKNGCRPPAVDAARGIWA